MVDRRVLFVVLASLSLALNGCSRMRSQLHSVTGVVALQLCTLEQVTGLSPERAEALYLEPQLGGVMRLVHVRRDTSNGRVTAYVPGFASQSARVRPGAGCSLEHTDVPSLPGLPAAYESIVPPLALDGAHRAAHFDVASLDAAVDAAFRESPGEPPRNTLAVVVLHRGRLVAERYAEGIDAATPLPGWSMTKSVTATLVGVAVEQGLLDVHAPGAIREWHGTEDPRATITLDHLLRMTSGLRLDEGAERGDGLDPTSLMLLHEADAAAYAARQRFPIPSVDTSST